MREYLLLLTYIRQSVDTLRQFDVDTCPVVDALNDGLVNDVTHRQCTERLAWC